MRDDYAHHVPTCGLANGREKLEEHKCKSVPYIVQNKIQSDTLRTAIID